MSEEGFHSGKIVVKSRNSQFKVTIPYRARVLRGGLRVNDSCTHFLLEGDGPPEVKEAGDEWSAPELPGLLPTDPESLFRRRRRNLTVTNEFAAPVVVHRVEVPGEVVRFLEVRRAAQKKEEEKEEEFKEVREI